MSPSPPQRQLKAVIFGPAQGWHGRGIGGRWSIAGSRGSMVPFFFFFLPEQQQQKKNNDEKCVWEIQTLYCSTRSIALQYSAQIIGWKIISGKYSSQHLTRGLFPNSKEIFVKQSLRTTNIWALIVSV